MNFAQKSGTSVMEKKYDAKMQMTTPSARSVNRYRLTPLSRKTGKKTMEVATVAASTASDTSEPPSSAALSGGAPSSMKRTMFSSTTTELSMRRESTSAMPPRSMVLMVPPKAFITSRHKRMDIGMDSSDAPAARGLPRKSRIMIPVSARP